MMGARVGCYQTVIAGSDHVSVSHLDKMEEMYLDFIETMTWTPNCTHTVKACDSNWTCP